MNNTRVGQYTGNMNAASLREQCLRCISQSFTEFSDKQLLRVPCSLRHVIIPFDKLSLVDLWRLEKRGILDGMFMDYFWDQTVEKKKLNLSGLDFVHRYDIQPPKCKAVFYHSIGSRDIFFQRLWKDVENLFERKDQVSTIHGLLFSASSGIDVPPSLRLTDTQSRSFVAIEALKLALECGFRPSYLSCSALMELLKTNAEIMKILTSRVIGVNTPCAQMEAEWFENVLSNPIPTLKLSVHNNVLSTISSCVLKCGERKKFDELIIRLDDKAETSEELSSFTSSIVKTHCSHLRLLEITNLHPSHVGFAGEPISHISSASSLSWFLQQPNFSCLRLSGVVSTTVGKSLILTFLSTPCSSLQRLELRNMVAGKADSSVQSLHLPENNNYYPLKSLLLDSICMSHAKELSLSKYLLHNSAVEQYKVSTECSSDCKSSITAWLFQIQNLRVGTLQVYDYGTNCIRINVPSTSCIGTLKFFVVVTSNSDGAIWTSPLFTSILLLPSLTKFIWDLRGACNVREVNNLAGVLKELGKKSPSCLEDLSISIDKVIGGRSQLISALPKTVNFKFFSSIGLGETVLTYKSDDETTIVSGDDHFHALNSV